MESSGPHPGFLWAACGPLSTCCARLPYGKILKFVPNVFTTTPIDVLCSNFVEFGRREIGKVVCYLPDKKFLLALQLSLLRRSPQKSARASPRQCAQSAPNFIQIGSFSAELYPNTWTKGRPNFGFCFGFGNESVDWSCTSGIHSVVAKSSHAVFCEFLVSAAAMPIREDVEIRPHHQILSGRRLTVIAAAAHMYVELLHANDVRVPGRKATWQQKPLITFGEISVTAKSNYLLSALLWVLAETEITTFGRLLMWTTSKHAPKWIQYSADA